MFFISFDAELFEYSVNGIPWTMDSVTSLSKGIFPKRGIEFFWHQLSICAEFSRLISNFAFKTIELDGKKIDIVEIKEGDNKPYIVMKRGPFVRRGSSDRIATRFELDAFYEKNKIRFAW